MSTTTPLPQRGWTDGRVRRARMFAVLLAVCAAAGLWATHQPWFAWATPGVVASCDAVPSGSPTVTVRVSDGTLVDGVAARGCVTGAELVASYSSPVGTAAGVSAAQADLGGPFDRGGPEQLLGMPRTTTVLVGCLALAMFGVATRRGYLPAIAVFVSQMAHQDLGTIRSLFLGGVGSDLTRSLPGLEHYTWALLLGSALMFTSALFVLKVNYEQRVEDRRRAREAGQDGPAEPLDALTDYLGRKISKVKSAANAADHQAVVAG